MERQEWVCERLQRMGYAKERHIFLYGEELEIISNPAACHDGFAIEGVVRKTGLRRRVRIPLMTVRFLEHEAEIELGAEKNTALAA